MKPQLLTTCLSNAGGRRGFISSTCPVQIVTLSLVDTGMLISHTHVHIHLLFPLCGLRAEGADEGPEAGELLAGDGPMGRLRGEHRPSVRDVGVLAHLLPHLQEPHPAAAHHEPRSVRKNQ